MLNARIGRAIIEPGVAIVALAAGGSLLGIWSMSVMWYFIACPAVAGLLGRLVAERKGYRPEDMIGYLSCWMTPPVMAMAAVWSVIAVI